MGDFNLELNDPSMKNFLNSESFRNLIKINTFNPIQDGVMKRAFSSSFFAVTSTNVGISP